MKKFQFFSRFALGTAFLSATFLNAYAADATIRELAKERGRFIGTILNSEWFNDDIEPQFEEIHKTQFNVVVAENEMKFDATEPKENEFNFEKGDKMVKYAQANGLRVRGHALAWHSQVANWVNDYKGQKEKLLAVLKNHITKVVGHWKGQIAEWDVVNEAVNDDYNADWRSTNSVWYEGIGAEFLDSAFVWAHEADPDAELCYNATPWNGVCAKDPRQALSWNKSSAGKRTTFQSLAWARKPTSKLRTRRHRKTYAPSQKHSRNSA